MSDLPTSYEECWEIWFESRRRKLANNTYLTMCENGPQGIDGAPFSFGIKLHQTEVVTFNRSGLIELDSGGWRTVTTKDRMNRALDPGWGKYRWKVWNSSGIWYVGQNNAYDTPYAYADGITLYPDGSVTGEGTTPSVQLKLRKDVRNYCKRYMRAFWKEQVPTPSGADCWFCLGVAPSKSSDHILSHIEESYFVPSLLALAIERFPVSRWAMHVVACYWKPAEREARGIELPRSEGIAGVTNSQLEKALRRYLYERTGSAS
jgi:hypothetical protein